jgi:glycosyltransferase involved in cell wall biosynthesis
METLPPDMASTHSASNLMQSKLTILIPTWNRKKHLEALLNVLLPQLLKRADVDLIVSSNGSTDGTVEYLETLRHTPRTLIVHQPVNLGANIHLAWLYGQARGEYLWMIGDDDLIEPDALDIVCQTLYDNLGIGWIHITGIIYVFGMDEPLQTKCPAKNVYKEQARALFADYGHWPSWVSSNVIAAQLIQKELLSVKFSTSFWPWQLLMQSVANHPAVVLGSRKVTAGKNSTWLADRDNIIIIELPRMLFESGFLTCRERRNFLYFLYGLYPVNFARLLSRAPGMAWRIIFICPALLNWRTFRAFIKVVIAKCFPRRENRN